MITSEIFFFGCRGWVDLFLPHAAHKLIGDLFENLFSEGAELFFLEWIEFDKLDDVSGSCLSPRANNCLFVSIKLNHVFEIVFSDTYYDNTYHVLRALDNQILCFFHVVNFTIGEDEQYVINRIILGLYAFQSVL